MYGIFLLLASLLFIFGGRIYQLLIKIDIYEYRHYFPVGSYMRVVKNIQGGFFSVMFFISAITLISLTFANLIDNKAETKALVPLVSVQKKFPDITGNIEVSIRLKNYGGNCNSSK